MSNLFNAWLLIFAQVVADATERYTVLRTIIQWLTVFVVDFEPSSDFILTASTVRAFVVIAVVRLPI